MTAKQRAKPHSKARLCIPDPESKDQRWVIKYKAWDIAESKLRLLREVNCNSIPDLSQRKIYCKKRIDDINTELANGAYFDPIKLKKQIEVEEFKLNHQIIFCVSAPLR